MTNEEFLKESLSYPQCPNGFEQTYDAFCRYQKLVMDTLREFARICEMYDIHYQLAFGSMLGAVRDHGQIPWDYDADVVVPFYEKDRLIHALKTDLNKAFYFCSSEDDPSYYPSFIRIVPKGYPHDMLHVDVFYVLGIPDNEPERSDYIEKAREQYNARKYTVINPFVFPGSMKTRAKITAKKW